MKHKKIIKKSQKKIRKLTKTKTKKNNKKSLKKQRFFKLNCSPENKDKDYTCYSDDDLLKLKDMWNARHPDKPIIEMESKDIWNKLKNYYINICNKESCWIRQMTKNTRMEKDLLDAFAPESPKEWKKKIRMNGYLV